MPDDLSTLTAVLDMQSLRMDEPDMLLMDDHGGDDDQDPFTARCMSFQVRRGSFHSPLHEFAGTVCFPSVRLLLQ